MFGFVENNREMGRLDPRRAIAHELEKLGAEEPHRSGRQTVGAVIIFRELVDRLEIRAKDERRSVNQENMVAGLDWAFNRGSAPHRGGQEAKKNALARDIMMELMTIIIRYLIEPIKAGAFGGGLGNHVLRHVLVPCIQIQPNCQ